MDARQIEIGNAPQTPLGGELEGPAAADMPGIAALSTDPSPAVIRDLLHGVIDPELGVDIVELGLLREVTVEAGVASIRFTVTTPACPLSEYIEDEIHACLAQAPGLRQVLVECELEPPWRPEEMSDVARGALGWMD